MIMKYILVIIISYLIGCFTSAYIIGKVFKNIDIRNYGSGNVGSTNVLRVMGAKLGIFTFLLDVLKGVLAVYLGRVILGDVGGLIGCLFVVIGHDWPIFIGFKGGKGIATSIGALSVLYGPIILIPIIITFVIIMITKYVSLGSISFLILSPITYTILASPFKKEYLIVSIILAIIGIVRHRENIIRLVNNEENKIKLGK